MIQKQKDTPSFQTNELSRQFIYIATFASPKISDVHIQTPAGPQAVWWYQQGLFERQHLPLGENLTGLIYDLWCGFHPDTFAALSCCVLGGGPVVLLGPPLEKLPLFNDPMYSKISTYPAIDPVRTQYLRSIQQSLYQLQQQNKLKYFHAQTQTELEQQLKSLMLTASLCFESVLYDSRVLNSADTTISTINKNLESISPTQQQSKALQEVLQQVNSGTKTWWSLIANRGFGKTTFLHLLTAHLLHHQGCITQKRTSIPVYWLTHTQSQQQKLQHLHPNLLPVSLEKLRKIGQQDHNNHQQILIIDETAKLSGKALREVLQSLKQKPWFVIVASSIDGYEGSGKQMNHLAQEFRLTPLTLTRSLRWAANDPLDYWVKTTLYAQTQTIKTIDWIDSQPLEKHHFETNTQDFICNPFKPTDLSTQAQWMNLMSHAHYRTRPSDLRIMLDAPNQIFFALQFQSQLVGGLWLSEEGPLPECLHDPILAGKRRLKGHLAPQYAAKHHVPNALKLKWLRIVRIAVEPRLQHQGLGTCLIKACRREYNQLPLAVSFQPKDSLARFWSSLNFTSVTPGFWIRVNS